MVGLKFVLAAKALFNAADDVKTQAELRAMVLDAKESINIGKACLMISHGRDGDSGRVLLDADDVEKAILIELGEYS